MFSFIADHAETTVTIFTIVFAAGTVVAQVRGLSSRVHRIEKTLDMILQDALTRR